MRSNPYRSFYAALLRLYPRSYRERFGDGMRQTFSDVCREHALAGESLLPFFLSSVADTMLGILKEHFVSLSFLFMSKTVLRPLIATLLILILPAIGELTVDDWDWGVFGFIGAGVFLFVGFLTIELIAQRMRDIPSRIAVGITVVTTLLIIWVNLAVGIIGDGNNTSAMYFLVVPVGLLGLAASRLKPKGLSLTAFCMAAVVLLVPSIAWLLNDPHILETPGPQKVFILSACLASMYAAAGILFRNAASSAA